MSVRGIRWHPREPGPESSRTRGNPALAPWDIRSGMDDVKAPYDTRRHPYAVAPHRPGTSKTSNRRAASALSDHTNPSCALRWGKQPPAGGVQVMEGPTVAPGQIASCQHHAPHDRAAAEQVGSHSQQTLGRQPLGLAAGVVAQSTRVVDDHHTGERAGTVRNR